MTLAATTALIGTSAPAVAATSTRTSGPATVGTVRSDGGYDVYVNGARRAHIPSPDPFKTLVTSVSDDGSRVALIPDHDTTHGSKLLILDTATGRTRTIATGSVMSARFSADGRTLAYTTAGTGGPALHVGPANTAGRVIARLAGRQARIVGFDGRSVLVSAFPDRHDDRAFVPSLLRADLGSGKVTTVLAGDLAHQRVYRDFRLVPGKGAPMVSFIRSTGASLCSGGSSELVLARTDGTTVRTFGRTRDWYREATWNGDTRQVAFSMNACPDGKQVRTAPEAAARRADSVAGTYLADVSTGRRTRAVAGLSSDFRLAGVDRGVLRIASDRLGDRTVNAAAIARGTEKAPAASSLAPQEMHAMARTNSAAFVNQVYDTRDEFDGRGSCAPTSAVMDLAGYQLGPWPLTVNYGGTHVTQYGRYVTDAYTYNGTAFNRTSPDYSGNGAWAGAHGWMYDPQYGTIWARLFDYLNRHTGWAQENGWDDAWVKHQIDIGNLVVVAGDMTDAGHMVLIKGYTNDGKWIVNDPFGPESKGVPGGENMTYDDVYLQATQVWGN
jgi:hypothetical protein